MKVFFFHFLIHCYTKFFSLSLKGVKQVGCSFRISCQNNKNDKSNICINVQYFYFLLWFMTLTDKLRLVIPLNGIHIQSYTYMKQPLKKKLIYFFNFVALQSQWRNQGRIQQRGSFNPQFIYLSYFWFLVPEIFFRIFIAILR